MRREVRATANRLANFDDANLRRSARAAVAAGAGVSIVPRSSVRDGEDGAGLHMLRLSGAGLHRQIYLVYNKARKMGPAGRNFLAIFAGARKAAGRAAP